MIRETQSYLINITTKRLHEMGWVVLYTDLPGGRRSGVGIISQVNSLLERIYNLSPDIILFRNSTLLIIEVNHHLDAEYIDKFRKYQERAPQLLDSLSGLTGQLLASINFGFVAKSNSRRVPYIPSDLKPFYYIRIRSSNLDLMLI